MLRRYATESKKLVEKENSESSILVFSQPTEEEKNDLLCDFKIDRHTLTCSLDPDEPSRLELQPHHVALIFKIPRRHFATEQARFEVTSLGLFLFDRKLIILCEENPLELGIASNLDFQSAEDVLLKIISLSIERFQENLRVINTISDEIEKKISRSMENKFLLQLFDLEKSLVYYLNAIDSNSFVLEKIKMHSNSLPWVENRKELLEDLLIDNHQCHRQAEIYSSVLASLMDARGTIVSNNLNILIKTLNIVTIAIMVPTLIVSIFSMNVPLPWQHHALSFWVVNGIGILSALGVYFWWKYIRN